MLSRYRNWALALLALVSLSSIVAYRLGVFALHLDLLSPANHKDVYSIVKGSIRSEYADDEQYIRLHCQVTKITPENYCSFTIRFTLSNTFDDHVFGKNLSRYTNLNLDIDYEAPLVEPMVRVTFRNHDKAYVKDEDYTSFKYNSLVLNPVLKTLNTQVSMQSFSVEPWWIDLHNVPSIHQGLDFSNITYIEIVPSEISAVGDYHFKIKRFLLVGQAISEEALLLTNMIVWLVVSLIFSLQRNRSLKLLAKTDTLTGVLNRRGLSDWVNIKLNSFYPKSRLTLFYIDLDDFKRINDAHGHNAGDEVLVNFSQSIQTSVKSFQNEIRFKFARLAGDEFALVVSDLSDENVTALAKLILADLGRPMSVSATSIRLNGSIGISCSSKNALSFEEMLHQADVAMYYAKNQGKNQYKKFDAAIAQDNLEREAIATKLSKAIDNNAFRLVFMPIYECASKKMAKVEVLLRHCSEELTGIGPDVFIPIAEEFHLINKIDLWVIEHTFIVINQHKAQLKAQLDLDNFRFCINVSARELSHEHFNSQFSTLLLKYAIEPEWIEIEITETSLVDVTERSIASLASIRDMGIDVALDDFGTGYTAFNQLINYPVNCLKIDKSFVDDLSESNKTKATMVKAILSIAESFDLCVVAEGIETQEQFDFLLDNNCDYAQGYFLSKPIPFERLLELLHSD